MIQRKGRPASGKDCGKPSNQSLFQRSLDRGRRLETGLAARGFTGDLPQLGSDRTASGGWLLAGVLLPVAVAAVSLSLPG